MKNIIMNWKIIEKQDNIRNMFIISGKVTMLFTQSRMNLKIYQVMKF
jgi:hypothetical protein